MKSLQNVLDAVKNNPETVGYTVGPVVGGALTWFVNRFLEKKNRINMINGMIAGSILGRAAAGAYKLSKDSEKTASSARPAGSTSVPAKVTGRNNDFNLRHYYQGWLGEDTNGLNRGDILNFTSKKLGWRAGARNARNILMKLKAGGKVPSIRNFTTLYSPAKGDFSDKENNTDRHMKNISKLSVLGLDDPINPDDNSQFFKFLTGLAMSESGSGSLKGMTYNDIMNAIRSGRKSAKTK